MVRHGERMNRREYPHNTSEQIRGYLDDALAIVNELDPPADLRAAVFTEAVRLIAAKQIIMEQPAPINMGAILGPHRGH